MTDADHANEPEPAAVPEPPPHPLALAVDAWFDAHFRQPLFTRSVDLWNAAQAAKEDLVAILLKI